MVEHKRYVVGVDGGGTKTHVILVDLDGTIIAESIDGPTNLQLVGIQAAARTLFELISGCCKKAECSSDALESIVLGLAGSGRMLDRTELINTLSALSVKKKFPLAHIVAETDARIALEAAHPGRAGIVLIAGTGSIALYRTEDGKFLRAGGWGNTLGDEGSGFAIARDALNAALKQHDGRGDKTVLTKKALEHFNITNVEDLITKVYQDRADIAAFVPNVLEAVAARDHVAHAILVKNANELAELVRVLTMKARPKSKLPLCLMGGLLESENEYSKMVKEKIVRSLPHVVVQKPKFPAAYGAAILGLNVFR
ncbi:MAG: hypothetical protein HY707_10335 [Ignavibacteriae bacterium]|nr:hypothetical protein [Ignavibacteriota bacterium]